MTDNNHERARRLIDRRWVEGLPKDEEQWLDDHLSECSDCERWASRTDTALRTLIRLPVAMPSGLAAATSLRVRHEAERRQEERIRNIGLVVGCALSWILGVASAPLVWKICAWVGAEFDLPRAVWIAGFAAWWLVPGSIAALLILWQRQRLESEGELGGLGRR